MVDLQSLLAPVAAADPCGPDLGDDPALLELERLAAGVAEQRMAWSVRPGQPPDWAEVDRLASAWLQRSKDWRVALLLVRAWLHLHRWRGLEPGLALLLGLWKRYGREVHPRPDADVPGGWLGAFDGDEADSRPRLLRHLWLSDLGALQLGRGEEVITVAELERLQEQRLLEMPWDFDATPVHRALDSELAAEPALESTLAAALSLLDELGGAIETAIRAPAPHLLLARLRLRIARLSDALRSRHGGGDELPAPAPAPSEPGAWEQALPRHARRMTGTAIPPLPVEHLAGALSSDNPCGPDLEYDPAHFELMRLAEGVPERQFGDFIEPAQPPDWPEVYWRALELFRRTRDLRVAAVLARAAAATRGWKGATEGLQLVGALVERWWPAVHPMLDVDDNNDATMRVNALAALGAHEGLLGELRRIEFGDASSVVLAGDIERLLRERSPAAGLPRDVVAQLQVVVQLQLEREPGLGDHLRDLQAVVERVRDAVQARTLLDDPLLPLSQFLNRLRGLVDDVAAGRWWNARALAPAANVAGEAPLEAPVAGPRPAEPSPPVAGDPGDMAVQTAVPDAAAARAAAGALIARIQAWLETATR